MCNGWRMATTLLTASALADALDVDRSTIHRRVARGDLTPAAYAGRQPLFALDDLARLKRGEQQLPTKEDAK